MIDGFLAQGQGQCGALQAFKEYSTIERNIFFMLALLRRTFFLTTFYGQYFSHHYILQITIFHIVFIEPLFYFSIYFVLLMTEKVVSESKKLISISKQCVEHPFAVRNKQQPILGRGLIIEIM